MKKGAVCVRCGGFRAVFRDICPHCGHRPEGEGVLVAWLLSEENLDPERLQAAAERVRGGEVIRPSDRMIERARKALGTHFSSDPGLTVAERAGLLALGLLVTPLPGWVLWAWWRRERPRAALQALGLSLPASALWFAGVLWLGLA
jgi:hypothetical protein